MDRRASSRRALGRIGLDFEFFDAIDGSRLSDAEVSAAYDASQNARQYKRPLSRPEVGCYLSHYALWKRIVDDDLDGAVILEDDFEADESLKHVVDEIRATPLNGALVKLFARKPCFGKTIAPFSERRRLVAPNRVPGLTLGYALDRTAAEMMLVNALPFSRPLDMDIKHWWEFSTPVLVVEPSPLRVGVLGYKSGIGPARDAVAMGANVGAMGRFVANLRYQFDYNRQLFHARAENRRAVRRLRRQVSDRGQASDL